MMQHLSAGGIVCRILGLALLGFVAVSTAGIVLPLLFFAAMGYGVYGLFLYLWTGKWPQGWDRIPAFAKAAFRNTWHVVEWPVRKAVQFVAFVVTGVLKLSWGTVKLGWMTTTEILSDAIIGAALGVLIGIPMGADKVTVAVGAGVGGLAGLFSGIRKWRQSGKKVAELTPLHVPTQPPEVLIPVCPAAPQLVKA